METKKKILIFTTNYFPQVGGAEIAVQKTTDRLDDYDFNLVTPRFNKSNLKKERVGSINVHRVGFGYSWDKFLLPFWGFFWRNNCDVIWSIQLSYGAIASFFYKLRYPNKPLFLTVQEGSSRKRLDQAKWGLIKFWSEKVIKKADHIHVISRYLKDYVLDRGASCPITIVPNGVDLSIFKKIEEERDKRTIITASRLVEKNGVDTLIKAIAKLKLTVPDVKCLIVGGGSDESNLRALTKKLDVEGNVIFVGEVHQSELPSYFKRASVFIRPSRSEGLGNAFLEAMASGLVTVGTPVGGITDFLKEKETGFLVEPDDAFSLAAKLDYILNNIQNMENVIDNAYKLVREKYSWEVVASSINIVLKDILKKKKNILIATGIYPPDIGGPATYSKLLLEKLEKENFNIKILSYSDDVILNDNKGYILPFLKGVPKGGGISKSSLPEVATSLQAGDSVTSFRKILRSTTTSFRKGGIGGIGGIDPSIPQDDREEIQDDVERVSRKLPKGIRHMVYFWKCFKRAKKVDIVYAQGTISAGLPAMLATKLRGKKFIVRVVGDWVWEQGCQRFDVKEGIDDFQVKKYDLWIEFLRWLQNKTVISSDLI
ncbi:MAG: glycosyltransferase family 4 protein, partial [bacterium]